MVKNNDSLLSNCVSGGCGAKIESEGLSRLLAGLQTGGDPRLLVGYDTSDDAAVYQIDDERSLICTVDFFPPMINDAKTFGRIAAANALSDVWAMGGRPLLALNLVCFPESMDKRVLADILSGGAEKITEAGAVLGGGHSIYDKEPKYGLSVTGIVKTSMVLRNNTPKAGHKLILTKPLGVGIVMAALRVEMADEAAVGRAVASMERLNRYAAESMAGFDVSACTDVTGFGLLVHALEMAGDSASIMLYPDALPFIPEAAGYADEYLLTAAGQRNRNRVEKSVDVSLLPFAAQELMFDPQTSGGLLIAASPDEAEELAARIRSAGDEYAAVIGEIMPRKEDVILFR
ncbi:MAG: selenide, water dikinase SelD [Spirochaetaceae bacterium]|jgi:selenide,water dikinase|nr:selenide, water dikinase SelD [Spirochaetaceae bacterium]